jgi:hypothetical protein
MDSTIGSGDLCELLGISRQALSGWVKRGIITPAKVKGRYALQASVNDYCAHPREQASRIGGEQAGAARARLASAQASLKRDEGPAAIRRACPCRRGREAELRAALTELADG